VAQLAESLCFNLADPFAGHIELLSNFFERVVTRHLDTKTHPKHLRFTRSQAVKNLLDRFFEVLILSGFRRRFSFRIL
jgi:oligoribonuclease NrnB/cAMP/cGMP phosphodiesterase (DHH superfamily)